MKLDPAATAAMPSIRDLAGRMHERSCIADREKSGPIVFLVGAGASIPAGLPNGSQLRNQIYKRFNKRKKSLRKLLRLEILDHGLSHSDYKELTLFEFASILSRLAYGRGVIQKEVTASLSKIACRPLGIELIAHMAKHRYLDHVICLNFDELLDEAFDDELPERRVLVRTELEVPANPQMDKCYLVKPFGSLGEASYALTLDDVNQFGPNAIRDFITRHVTRVAAKSDVTTVLVMVGYRGAEKGFERLIQEYPGPLEIFVIDCDEAVAKNVWCLIDRPNVHSITLDADKALELLVEVLTKLCEDPQSWVPPARHRILSLCRGSVIEQPTRGDGNPERFRFELILQAVKSRGFVHLESFGKIPRLRKYGGATSSDVVDQLIGDDVLIRDDWLTRDKSVKPKCRFVPNYVLKENDDVDSLAKWLIKTFTMVLHRRIKWNITGDTVGATEVDVLTYVKEQLSQIARAPDIEVSEPEAREVQWVLGSQCRQLSSARELFKATTDVLKRFECGGTVRGIWSTGEWIFHKGGWAATWGKLLLARDDVTINMIITDPGGQHVLRAQRRSDVIDRLRDPSIRATVTIRFLDWWELNRILSIFEPDDEKADRGAVYFRRRLNQPLVQPYWIPFDHRGDHNSKSADYIRELWDWYWVRARDEPTGERVAMTMQDFVAQRTR